MSTEDRSGFSVDEINSSVRVVAGPPHSQPRWGDEIWVQTHDIRVIASWKGFPECVPGYEEGAGPYQPIPGWGILEIKAEVGSSSNGSHSTAVLAQGGSFISVSDLNYAYSSAIDMAVRAGKLDTAAKLKREMQEHRKAVYSWEAKENTYFLKAWARAHGSCADQKRGWHEVIGRARLVYIAEPNPATLLRALILDNGLTEELRKILDPAAP